MNAFPLRAPDGQVYAYACGRCHHVPASGSMLVVPEEPGPIALLVDSMRWRADECCHCMGCHLPLTGEARSGWCDECERCQGLGQMWRSIGYCMQRGITDRAGYDAARNKDWYGDSEDDE